MQTASEIPSASYQLSEKPDLESQSPMTEKFHGVDTPSEEDSSVKDLKLTRKELWKKRWDQAVRQGWWPRVLYSAFGLILGALWVGITVYFSTSEQKWSSGKQDKTIKRDGDNAEYSLSIIFDGSLKKFDQGAKTLTVSWSGTFINYTDPANPAKYEELPLNYPYGEGQPSAPFPIDVYRDVDTTFLNMTYPNSTDFYHLWVITNTSIPHIATIGNTADDNFDTDIDFQATNNSNVWNQPLFGYPLDKMTGSITFVTSYSGIGDMYQSGYNTSLFNFTDARLTDYSFNWRFDMSTESTCQMPNDFPNFTLGADLPVINGSVSSLSFPCHLRIDFTATRPPLVQFAVAMAVIVNWTSTLFIFVLTCESLLMRRGWMLSGTDLLGVTFTSLFALPTVRMLLPGAPDFGVLDLIGIIPNVIVISLCIVAIAVAKLNRRPHNEDTKNKAD